MIKKVLLGMVALVLLLSAAAVGSVMYARQTPPPQIVANFVDLEKIEKISTYRSCAGHVTVPQDERESKRNMKVYYWVKPEYVGSDTVEIYAPYDGYVSTIRDEPELGLEGEIWISPVRTFLPAIGVWSFSVHHIHVREDLKMGSAVRAGELIGYGAASTERGRSFDFIYGTLGLPPGRIDNWTAPFDDLDFIFDHMTDEVFAEYQKHGIASRDELYLTKEERDAKPCQYAGQGPHFINQEDPDNWVFLKD